MNTLPEKGTVLVVDDNAANRHLLNAILKKVGYEIEQCENGAQCVEHCLLQKPQIVLLDVMMPVMDGIEACQKIRAKYGKDELPIILVTTKIAGSDVAAGFAAGANDYVTKPIDRHVLMARIENQLRVAHSQQQIATAKRSMEQALRLQEALGNALPQAVFVHDQHGRIVSENQLTTLLCHGLSSVTVDELFSNLYGGALQDTLPSEWLSGPLRNVQDIDEEVTFLFDECTRHISITSRPVVMEDSSPLRLWVFREVTRERELEKQANQQVKMKTVSLFASGVAHNFNNLFGSILGVTEILKRNSSNPERLARCLHILEDAVSTGMRFTKRMYTAQAELRRDSSAEMSYLGEVIERCWSEVAAQHSEHEVIFWVEPSIETLLVAIPTRGLRAIFRDIFHNCFDAIQGNGRVSCSRVLAEEDEAIATIEVRDNGHGMDAETLTHLCEPFFSTRKMDYTNNVSVEGKGLGLWNVYNILRLAGGDIAIDSTQGEGTVVRLSMPLLVETSVKEVDDQVEEPDNSQNGSRTLKF